MEVVARLPNGPFVPLSTIGGIAPPSLMGPRFTMDEDGSASETAFSEFETRELQVTRRGGCCDLDAAERTTRSSLMQLS